jgi:hypothetical protein
MITLTGLTKRYGDKTAVDGLTVEITPGRVTAFYALRRPSTSVRSSSCEAARRRSTSRSPPVCWSATPPRSDPDIEVFGDRLAETLPDGVSTSESRIGPRGSGA